MRIIFMGTPQFAIPSLCKLAESQHELSGCVTVPDKPSGRSLKVISSPIKKTAQDLGIHLLQPHDLTEEHFINEIKDLSPDLAVVVAFRILPEAVYSIPRLGCINLHASLLPDLRGAAPINRAIMNGMTQTGLTTFLIEKSVDTGKILLQQKVDITPDDDAGSLAAKMSKLGADLMMQTIDEYVAGRISPQPQVGTVTKAPKILPDHCLIDWNCSAQDIHNQIRGLSPIPAAYTSLAGKRLKVFRSRLIETDISREPGMVEVVGNEVRVATLAGTLAIVELQLEGKKRMNSSDFLRGYNFQEGTRLG